MRTRLPAILLTLWWIAWGVFIQPGHTRGAIGVDGSTVRTDAGTAISLFFSSTPSCCETKSSDHSKSPSAPRSSNCALCKIVGHPGMASALFLDLKPALSLLSSPPSQGAQVAREQFLPTFLGRAPPLPSA